MMRVVIFWLLSALMASVHAEVETRLQQLEKSLARIQQESQSTYQQFLMIQELRRNELSENPVIAAPNISPEKSVPIPNYEDFMQQRQVKQERIKQYAIELDALFGRYKELEAEKQTVIEQMNMFEKKAKE